MKYLAVIDTNVIVSALISKNPNSPTKTVFKSILNGSIIPLYHQDILEEYEEVLGRAKFHLNKKDIKMVIDTINTYGFEVFPSPTGEIFLDEDDLIFYEVAMEKQDDNTYLVTGNQKHYPIKKFIVTPAEMVDILNGFKIEKS